MGSQDSGSSASFAIQKQIDDCCQRFEEAWKGGDTPRIEEFVASVPPSGRTQLLPELLILELNYRRGTNGESLSDSQICALHPELPHIAAQLKLLRDEEWLDSNDGEVTQRQRAT